MEGKRLGPYELLGRLGAGGMGSVWRAVVLRDTPDAPLGTIVALKIVHSHLFSAGGFFKRFLREADLGKRIRHENVVRTLDVDATEVDGETLHYLVTEYVEGQTLRALLDELVRVPEGLCRHIGREIAKGLDAIHTAGVVHRDLKPENVLITPEQVVKIMDLGVARLADEKIRLSDSGEFVGSVLYAAPEQFSSGGEGMDYRADLYALGLLLYELATGEHPIPGDDAAQVMQRQISSVPRPASDRNPQVSPFFDELLATLLEKDPEDRIPDAAEVLAILRDGERGEWWRRQEQEIRKRTRRPVRRVRIPRETSLYGRDAELARLRSLWTEVNRGEGRALLLDGEAGVGKTRLVDEFVARLGVREEDFHFLFGAYPPGGAATAAGAFSTAYREQFGEAGLADTLAAYLAGSPSLVPAFAALLRGEPAPRGEEPLTKESIQALFVRVTRALAEEKPTIVLVDDLHFAPEEGRALFAALALSVPGHRVLLVGTFRPGMPEEWLAGVERLEHTHRLTLARLGAKDLTGLLVDAFGSAKLAEELSFEIARFSDGNPFFVFEIIRGMRERGVITEGPGGTWIRTGDLSDVKMPSSLLDLIDARISGITDEEREILDLAACLGFAFDPTLIADATGLRRIPLLRSLARVERDHRLVRSAGPVYVFDHHQVKETLYGALAEPLRREYHGLLGEALLRRVEAGDPDADADLGALTVDLTEHLFAAGRAEDARPWIRPALDHLRRGYLVNAAADLARRALDRTGLFDGPDRIDVLLGLAEHQHELGRRAEELDALAEAFHLAESTGDEERRRRACLGLGRHHWVVSGFDEAEKWFTRALDLARRDRSGPTEAAALNGLGDVALSRGRYEEAIERFEAALVLRRAEGDVRGEGTTRADLGHVYLFLGRPEEARACYEHALALARETGNRRGEGSAQTYLGIIDYHAGRFDRARQRYGRAISMAREIGARGSEASALGNLANVEAHLGDLGAARESFLEARGTFLEIADAQGAGAIEVGLAEILLWLGEREGAEELLVAALARFRQSGGRREESYALAGLADVAEQAGDLAAAERRAGEAAGIRREIGYRKGVAATRLQMGRIHLAGERIEAARDELLAARDAAREAGDVPTDALAGCLLARLPDHPAADAVEELRRAESRLGVLPRFEAWANLWLATGDARHLAAARALLDSILEHVPEDRRDAVVSVVPLYRRVRAG